MSEWRVTGDIIPNDSGGFSVDLRAFREGAQTNKNAGSKKVGSLSGAELDRAVEEAMDRMGDRVALFASQLVDVMAAKNKSGQVALSRAYREVYLPVADWAGQVGEDAAAHGLGVAVEKSIPNVNYAKRAAESYSQGSSEGSGFDRYELVGGE